MSVALISCSMYVVVVVVVESIWAVCLQLFGSNIIKLSAIAAAALQLGLWAAVDNIW